MPYFGCHLSSSGGFCAMLRASEKLGGNTFQYFTRNPRGTKAKEPSYEDVQKAVFGLAHLHYGPLIAHAPYTMNLCTKEQEARDFAAGLLRQDLELVHLIPGTMYNLHPGCHVGQGVQAGVGFIAAAITHALSNGHPVTVLLETMAGKGSEIGGSFRELAMILEAVASPLVGVCLDTCHVWDGGYDIRNNLDGVLGEFDKTIGLSRLKAIHLNDSMNPLGARKDRHACLGEGFIGLDTFEKIVNHPALQGLPMVLETPNDNEGYAREIAMLKKWEDEKH